FDLEDAGQKPKGNRPSSYSTAYSRVVTHAFLDCRLGKLDLGHRLVSVSWSSLPGRACGVGPDHLARSMGGCCGWRRFDRCRYLHYRARLRPNTDRPVLAARLRNCRPAHPLVSDQLVRPGRCTVHFSIFAELSLSRLLCNGRIARPAPEDFSIRRNIS